MPDNQQDLWGDRAPSKRLDTKGISATLSLASHGDGRGKRGGLGLPQDIRVSSVPCAGRSAAPLRPGATLHSLITSSRSAPSSTILAARLQRRRSRILQGQLLLAVVIFCMAPSAALQPLTHADGTGM